MNQEATLKAIGVLAPQTMRPVVHGKGTKVLVDSEHRFTFRRSAGNTLDVDSKHVDALLKSLGISTATAKEITPDTLGRVATDILGNKQKYNLVLDGKTGKVVDIVKPNGVMVEAERLLQNLERAVPGGDYGRVYSVQPHVLRLEMTAVQEAPVVRGDLIRAGTVVMFSPFGVTMPTVEAFAVRLACTNGATSETVLRAFKPNGEGDSIWTWLRHSVKESVNAVGAIAAKYAVLLSQNIPAGERGAMLEAMLQEARLSSESAAAVRDHALQEPPRNQYEMLNLLTWASSHLQLPGIEIARTQRAAGRFLDHPERIQTICVSCRRPIGQGHAHALAAPVASE